MPIGGLLVNLAFCLAYRSFASLLGVNLGESEAIDSEDHLGALTGKSTKAREWMLEESYSFSARQGNWKYIAPIPENKKVPAFMANKGVESGVGRIHQLYDLSKDPGEKQNLADSMPELVQKMQEYVKGVVNKQNAGATVNVSGN